MIFIRKAMEGQALALALLTGIFAAGAGFAHGLPGSVLTLSRDGAVLAAHLTMPLEELVIANPELADLQDVPTDQKLSPDQQEGLATYFADHFAIELGPTRISVTLNRARLDTATHHDVGQYTRLGLDFAADLPDDAHMAPFSLIYDAVMHEVRSHSATVYWKDDQADPIGLAKFYYKAPNGQPQRITLDLP